MSLLPSRVKNVVNWQWTNVIPLLQMKTADTAHTGIFASCDQALSLIFGWGLGRTKCPLSGHDVPPPPPTTTKYKTVSAAFLAIESWAWGLRTRLAAFSKALLRTLMQRITLVGPHVWGTRGPLTPFLLHNSNCTHGWWA